MKWLLTLFAILYFSNIIIDSVSFFKEVNSTHKQAHNNTQKTNSRHRVSDVVVFAICTICYLFSIAFLIWSGNSSKSIIILLVIVPCAILNINNAIKASGPIKDIIIGNNTNLDLSIKERFCFDIVGGTFIYIYSSVFSGKVEQIIIEFQINHVIIEFLLVMYSAIVAFGLSFFTIVQLIRPIKYMQKLCVCVSLKLKRRTNTIIEILLSGYNEGSFVTARFTNYILDVSSKYQLVFKILNRIVFIPFTIVIDVLIGLLLCIYWYLICGCVLVFLEFFGFLGKGFMYFLNITSNIPDRRIVKNTFRLSLVASVIIVVIINRYALIYEFDEAFLNISEFIASAIIIPVIFEWIYSNNKSDADLKTQLPINKSEISSQDERPNNSPKSIVGKKAKYKYKRKKK